MIKWIRKIKKLIEIASRIELIKSELNEIDSKMHQRMCHFSTEFENKIQKMSHDYTANLQDTKTEYLKKYLEVRMDCMQQQIDVYPKQISSMQIDLNKITMGLEHKEI